MAATMQDRAPELLQGDRGLRGPRRQLVPSRARVAGITCALVGAGLTIALTVTPGLHFAYRRPILRAGFETIEAAVVLLVAYLVVGRLRRTRSLADLLAATALGTLAAGNLIFDAVPALASEGAPHVVLGWAGVCARVVGAFLFAAAALAPQRRLSRLPRAATVATLAAGATVGLIALGVWAVRASLPPAPSLAQASRAASWPDMFHHGGAFGIQLATMLAYTAAAVGFARSAERRPNDDLMIWFGVGAIFAAYSWLDYFLSPGLFYGDWIYTADILRLLFYVMLLVGGIREINEYWRRSAYAAVLDERGRLARDLHDGLAQELAYITRASKQLRRGGSAVALADRLEASAERALRESRQVIAALATSAGEPLEAVVERVASEAAARFGADVAFDVVNGVRLDPARQEALVRITGEAVTNAARHSGSREIEVTLRWRSGRPLLRVRDRGRGFVPGVAAGFGLNSMRDRAASVGAQLSLETAPGSGTSVEVAF